MAKKLLLALLLAFGAYQWWSGRAVEVAPGVLVTEAPRQRDLTAGEAFEYDGYRIRPLAEFEMEARVLGKERYRTGREAQLAPYDLALGWGPMSDSATLAALDIRQGGRRFFWSARELPIPRRELETHATNAHLIPATFTVRDRLDDVRPGQLIALSGKLVEIDADDGWRWRSSLSREDTGDGACELIWVEALRIL